MTRKIYSFIPVLITALVFTLGSTLNAQSVFWTEDFSTGSQYTVSLGGEGNDGSTNYFHRTDGSDINKSYTGAVGFFFAGQDLDDGGWTGSASPSQLTWTGIDISGKSNIEFTGLFGEAFDTPGDIDAGDYLYLEYRIDNGTWDTLVAFRNDGSQYNSNFWEDTDLDGIGDGMLISNDSMNSVTKTITGTGSLMDLRFTASVNSGDEDFAIDEFQLSGTGGSGVTLNYLWDEEFDPDLSGVDTVNVTGPQVWQHANFGHDNNCAKMSGYAGSAVVNEDWILSPSMDLTNYDSLLMVFSEAINYGDSLDYYQEVYVSTNYNGDPAAANWTELAITNRSSGSSWSFVEVDTVDLTSYTGNSNVTVGFKYSSSNVTAATWEIDYIHIFGHAFSLVPSVSLSKTSVTGLDYLEGNGPSPQDTITVAATDIIDSLVLTVPASYEISLNATSGYGDTLVIDDVAGVIASTDVYVRLKAGLMPGQYTGNLKVSTSGTPAQNISLSGIVDQLPSPFVLWDEDFKPSLAGLDTVSVTGPQVWEHGTFGSDNNCAVMSGYDGSAVANEDWLISPVMDFSTHSQVVMTFSEAINFESANIADREEVMISTDYNGDPSTATWTELSVTGRAPGDSWSFVDVDTIDLSAWAGVSTVTVAFKYTSTSNSAGTWEIDHVKVFDKDTTNFSGVAVPLNFSATATSGTEITLDWDQNASGDDVMIAFNAVNDFGMLHDDSTYVVGDTLAGGAEIIYNGAATTFDHVSLQPGMTYYYQAWSATDSSTYSLSIDAQATTHSDEPASHVTLFQAEAFDSTQVDVTWSDAAGADAYLIKMSDQGYGAITAPVDGTDEAEDTLFADGDGLVKVSSGIQFYSFSDLDPNTVYYFKIWPYNNSGSAINYKTDGNVPQDTATTPDVTSGIAGNNSVDLISSPVLVDDHIRFTLNVDEAVVVSLYSINGQLISKSGYKGRDVEVKLPVDRVSKTVLILNVQGNSARNTFKLMNH